MSLAPSLSDWRLACASAIGSSHLKSGTPCQDYCVCEVFEVQPGATYLMMAVCDGAGSAAHSDDGSRLAAEKFKEIAREFLTQTKALHTIDRNLVLEWLLQINAAIVADAEAKDRYPRDYACTLLGAIVGQESAVFFQVGDGAIVVSHGDDDGWSYIFWPQHGEFANTTNFVGSPNMPEVIDFAYEARRIDEISMFSDGLENLVLHNASRSVHGPFFKKMIEPLRKSPVTGVNQELSQSLSIYLNSDKICERTDDDKTLVLATRQSQ